jgi:glutamate synthase domain-containing protein 2/glutamate synthase domain-containing protein 1/glutamate synthase domain-containing protein 3
MDPNRERDGCGVGFVADATGRASHRIVVSALGALTRLRHRGAVDADARTGDGAGLLLPIPRPWLTSAAVDLGAQAPVSRLGVAVCFLSTDPDARAVARRIVETSSAQEGLRVVAWRPVPVRPEALGERARATAPAITQALIEAAGTGHEDRERRAYLARRRIERAARDAGLDLCVPSLSFRTITYKALCAADQLAAFYPDLSDPDVAVPFAVFHQRYSTNTAPSWDRAQPFRVLCHNGEINTLQGNAAMMRAREGSLGGELGPPELLRPVLNPDGSDSAMLDNAVELLVRGGRDIRHALAMLIPPAWEGDLDLPNEVRDFHRYHGCLTEPWDGPAALVFTDGIRVGAALDRNGLRPLRYAVCQDGLVACASEAGAVDVRGHGSVRRGKLGPGQLISVEPGAVLEDAEIRSALAARRPYGEWVRRHLTVGQVGGPAVDPPPDLVARQVAFGITKEEITLIVRPMAVQGHEPTSSMGDDTPPAVLASTPRPVTHFLRQRFAQVTNPPIDHLQERAVMSLRTRLGPRAPLLEERPEAAALVELPTCILTPDGVCRLQAVTLEATFPVSEGPDGLKAACHRLGRDAEAAVQANARVVVISDRSVSPGRAPVPAVLAVGAVHHFLIRAGLRTRTSVVADAGDVRDGHDAACLLGYGAEAVCPRTAMEVVSHLAAEGRLGGDAGPEEAVDRYRTTLENAVLKVMSKMGIATVDAYRGGQIFEAVGLDDEVVRLCLDGTPVFLGGLGFRELGQDVLARHQQAFRDRAQPVSPGLVKHRAGGEYHATNPEVVRALQVVSGAAQDPEAAAADALRRAVAGDPAAYRDFAHLVDGRPPTVPRDLLDLVPVESPLPLDQVEPADEIARRFSAGAMSHGALSAEAHEAVALGFRMAGGKANTGEGGEDRRRYRDDRNCAIKQVASGRFGVTPEYCAFADELQIKMAQGSKPGEGGQLPGPKVTTEIATLRYTPPGVELISPPPHHDIYSIEDLAQLIFDLKQVNPQAAVSVKLVTTAGVGTIAAGVAKGLADVIHLAGADGGTGASPLASILHAGLPWEIGLAEAHRTLAADGLRGRVRLRVDGGLKTGRDVAVAALLGADEYSFGTAALVALGCLLVRTCHRDTCPVGIATQRPDLRGRFAGAPEMVARYVGLVAEDVRRHLAALGLRSVDEAVSRSDLLRLRPGTGRAARLDVTSLTAASLQGSDRALAPPAPRSPLGDRLCDEAFPALAAGRIAELAYDIGTGDRAVGARLGGAVARAFGDRRPPGRVRARFRGSAGQSFGAFLSEGAELELVGEANDYVGKGMAGGRIVIRPPEDDEGEPFLLGNTVLYGATGGQLFCAGRTGERFAVRNSGAIAVVEGVGDHAFEYMTGGAVVVLGPVGRNAAAGMSGGEAYVWDPGDELAGRVNQELVELRPPTGAQLPSLRRLVERHRLATGSRRAAAILRDWQRSVPPFVRIVPRSEMALIDRVDAAPAG